MYTEACASFYIYIILNILKYAFILFVWFVFLFCSVVLLPGYETIRLGISSGQDADSGHIVEHNLFEKCDGEVEIYLYIELRTSELSGV